MQREEKSERSRRQVLDAALRLFAHQGYRATTVRDIADTAHVSTGNVYHHFPDKETIFRTLLDEFWRITETRRYPFTRALTSGVFPDNLEQLGCAARDSVREFRLYITLIFVDVIEFDGTHVQKFYGEQPRSYAKLLEEQGLMEAIRKRLRPGVPPIAALLLATRIFINYFTMEIILGIAEPFGTDSAQVVRDIADILRHGMIE
jgi:AcrR family transcriptional regulator